MLKRKPQHSPEQMLQAALLCQIHRHHPGWIIDFTGKMPIPKRQRLKRCKACGQFAVYCGKWGEEWVWRCRYCGLVIPLTDKEMNSFGLNKE